MPRKVLSPPPLRFCCFGAEDFLLPPSHQVYFILSIGLVSPQVIYNVVHNIMMDFLPTIDSYEYRYAPCIATILHLCLAMQCVELCSCLDQLCRKHSGCKFHVEQSFVPLPVGKLSRPVRPGKSSSPPPKISQPQTIDVGGQNRRKCSEAESCAVALRFQRAPTSPVTARRRRVTAETGSGGGGGTHAHQPPAPKSNQCCKPTGT